MYFATDGAFLFGVCDDGRMNPIAENSSFSASDWQNLFKGTYLDVYTNVLYVKGGNLGLPDSTTYQFKSDGYYIGIWSKWSTF